MHRARRKAVKDSRLLIAGLARNCQDTIHETIGTLERATAGFCDRQILVVESDSDDQTVERLEELKNNYRLTYITLGSLQQTLPSRTERIAHCRNRILEFVRKSDPSDFDYVMLADMDGLNAAVQRWAVEDCWLRSVDWDVICANQIGAYYDVWALRHPHWVPQDCWRSVRELEPYFGCSGAREIAVHSRQATIQLSAPLLEVESAFGGLAIYRREAFVAGDYVGTANGHDICEHVPFHKMLRQNGFRIFINPQLINASPTDHLATVNWTTRLRFQIQYLVRRLRAIVYPQVGTYRPKETLKGSEGEM